MWISNEGAEHVPGGKSLKMLASGFNGKCAVHIGTDRNIYGL